jgi:hypothetical protein
MTIFLVMLTTKSSTLQFVQTYRHPDGKDGIASSVGQGNQLLTWSGLLSAYMVGMSCQISPVPADVLQASPLQCVEGAEHTLHCFQTKTRLMFSVLTTAGFKLNQDIFHELYLAYADYMLKHPSYTIDDTGAGQPINDKTYPDFCAAVDAIVARFRA